MRRRKALTLTAAAAAAPLARPEKAKAQPQAVSPAASRVTLDAVAEAVLPSALSDAERAEVVTRFLAWLRAFREGAELDHGYGVTRLRHTGASPAARYPAQLEALEAAARERGAASFNAPGTERGALIAGALLGAKVETLPERPDGRHVASDLMAFFYRSSSANDLCYGRKIGRDDCRGLPDSGDEPSPIGGS